MPRIKRWFPVSHDFLDDPETIELSKTFGDRAVFMWLKMLSWADRNAGKLGTVDHVAKMFGRCLDPAHPNRSKKKAELVLRWMLGQAWVRLRSGVTQAGPGADPSVMYISNYAKYHRTGEPQMFPPDLPDLYKEEEEATKERDPKKKSEPSWPSPELLIELYNDSASEAFPAVEKITEGRKKKAREYLKQFPELSFWVEVFGEMNSSRFLSGKQNGFRANFDWLLTKGKDGTENVVKVFEGRYRNDK